MRSTRTQSTNLMDVTDPTLDISPSENDDLMSASRANQEEFHLLPPSNAPLPLSGSTTTQKHKCPQQDVEGLSGLFTSENELTQQHLK